MILYMSVMRSTSKTCPKHSLSKSVAVLFSDEIIKWTSSKHRHQLSIAKAVLTHITTEVKMAPVSPKREDLVVPYVHVPPTAPSQPSAVISQSMPMAAMFMKNKLLSWFSLFTAVQTILNEPKTSVASDSGAQSPLIRFLMAFVGLAVCYMDLAFPGSSGPVRRRKVVEEVAEGISSTIATAVASATN